MSIDTNLKTDLIKCLREALARNVELVEKLGQKDDNTNAIYEGRRIRDCLDRLSRWILGRALR